MSLILNGPFRIEQKDVILFSDYEQSGEMWTGSGPRSIVVKQVFQKPFKSVPAVHCTLSMWDIDVAHNSRVDLRVENITEVSFDIVFRTWADTKVARARAHWIAIGETHMIDDGWDLY